MKIRYFSDTDTALIEFSNVSVAETKEISENLYIDLDEKGNLVSMTIDGFDNLKLIRKRV